MTIDELLKSYLNKECSKELEDLLKEYLKQGYIKIVH